MSSAANRSVNHLANRTFFQKWIRDAQPGWPIMVLAPLPVFFGMYIGYHHFFSDNTVSWNKTLRFQDEEMNNDKIVARETVRGRINEIAAKYKGVEVHE